MFAVSSLFPHPQAGGSGSVHRRRLHAEIKEPAAAAAEAEAASAPRGGRGAKRSMTVMHAPRTVLEPVRVPPSLPRARARAHVWRGCCRGGGGAAQIERAVWALQALRPAAEARLIDAAGASLRDAIVADAMAPVSALAVTVRARRVCARDGGDEGCGPRCVCRACVCDTVWCVLVCVFVCVCVCDLGAGGGGARRAAPMC